MAKKTFRYGPLSVSVQDTGTGTAPWDERGEPRPEYKVVVSGPTGSTYRTKAWGSIRDYETGELNHASMARMVVDELWIAIVDPDEFIDMVVGEAGGREAYERGKSADAIIKNAQKFGLSDLEEAANAARAEEERGGSGPKTWSPRNR